MRARPIEDRFHEKYEIDAVSGCWNWTAFTSTHGYGMIWFNKKNSLAHRVSWMIHNGDIPKKRGIGSHGVCVLHRCDNPKCVNPDHLFLGTHQDNMNDMLNKGRDITFEGEKHGMAKLKIEDVRRIRVLLNSGPTLQEIADEFNVALSTVSSIKYGHNWKSVN